MSNERDNAIADAGRQAGEQFAAAFERRSTTLDLLLWARNRRRTHRSAWGKR